MAAGWWRAVHCERARCLGLRHHAPPHKRPVRTGQGISNDVLSRLADLSAQRVAHEQALATIRAAQLPLIHEALAQARYGDMHLLMTATGYSREHLTEINAQRKAQDGSKT